MKNVAAFICCLVCLCFLTADTSFAQSETRVKVLSWDKVAWNATEGLKRGPIPTNRNPVPNKEKTETNKRTPSKVPAQKTPTRTKPIPTSEPAPSRIPSKRGEKNIPQRTPDYERSEIPRERPDRTDRRGEWEREQGEYGQHGDCERGGKGYGKGHHKGKHGKGHGKGHYKNGGKNNGNDSCGNRPPRCGNEPGNGKGNGYYKKDRYQYKDNSYKGNRYGNKGGGYCGTGYN